MEGIGDVIGPEKGRLPPGFNAGRCPPAGAAGRPTPSIGACPAPPPSPPRLSPLQEKRGRINGGGGPEEEGRWIKKGATLTDSSVWLRAGNR